MLLLIVLLAAMSAAYGQTPDLNGSWNLPYTPNMAKDIGELPFTAQGKAAYGKINTAYDPTGFCLFPGVPRINNSPFPMRIVQSKDSVVFLYEYMTIFRAVPLDVKEHSKNPQPTFMGESTGKWDGDTLNIDTVGFNDRTWLDTAGHPHSDVLHVTERYQLMDANHISYDVTVDDSKMYTRAWSNHRVLDRLKPDDRLMEYSCEEIIKIAMRDICGRGRRWCRLTTVETRSQNSEFTGGGVILKV
jgi:hypothetical protein